MSLANTSQSYGSAARLLHWLTAMGILIMIPLGWIAHRLPYDTESQLALKAQLFSAHKTLGIAVLAVALVRIAWALSQPKPAPLHPERRAETLLAETVHWLLYGSLILVPLSGWIEHAATAGFAPIWWPFGQSLPFVPKSPALAETFATLHFLLQWLLTASVLLHVAGAVKHALIDRDSTLARMSRGTSAGRPGKTHSLRPLIAALAVWIAVLGSAAATGLFATAATPVSANLEATDSDWQVETGSIALSLQQMGAEVTGSFADWSADISFEPQDTPGKSGEVRVQIAIPSLTLGSVTKQALGADFFNAEGFPVAIFEADILKAADGYAADGTLSLKGQTVPVSLPFSLHLEGDRAEMRGTTTLDRQTFGIGPNMTDPGQLGFDVLVTVALTATRAKDN